MALQGLFIAGTDTGAGKTRVTCGLLGALAAASRPAIGMKPVATGARGQEDDLLSEDAALIAASSARHAAISDINPYCFHLPVSPDIAAALAGVAIEPERVAAACRRLAARAEIVLIEGTGGWLTPIGPGLTMADIAATLGFPVLLVVGLKLGCINHALLTAAAIRARGCRFAGWVGNRIDPDYLLPEANLATLRRFLGAPPLAVLAHAPPRAAGSELAAAAARLFGADSPASPI
jgi:dethiobiotin synthetase